MIPNEQPNKVFELMEFRVLGLTDRDAPALYLLDPERTLGQLWTDKVEISDPCIPPFGSNLFEVPARDLMEEELFGKKPLRLRAAFARHAAIPFLRAEIDGVCFEDSVLVRVVQLPREEHDRVKKAELPIRDRVPSRNWIEIQHQLIVSGVKKAYFVSTFKGTTINYVVVPADPIFASNHVAECIQFWDYVRRGERPPGAEPEPKEINEELVEPGEPELPGLESTKYVETTGTSFDTPIDLEGKVNG